MDWKTQALMAVNALYAAFLGAIIGSEREREGRDAGVRTFAAVSLGACTFALISVHLSRDANPHVIAAGVVSGIGFLGAGVIMHEKGSIVGLTTAATLWACAAVGLCIGYELYVLGTAVAVLIFMLLALQRLPWWDRVTKGPARKKT